MYKQKFCKQDSHKKFGAAFNVERQHWKGFVSLKNQSNTGEVLFVRHNYIQRFKQKKKYSENKNECCIKI